MNKNIIIFDLDGTLALIDHRRHLVEKKLILNDQGHLSPDPNWKPDWDKFYEECDKDLPNEPVIAMYHALNNGHLDADWDIYIFSGRSEVVREKTIGWLIQQDIDPVHLFMRPDKNYTPDEELKKKWLENIGGPERIFCWFDDRQKVVDMVRSMGITCFQVAPGKF